MTWKKKKKKRDKMRSRNAMYYNRDFDRITSKHRSLGVTRIKISAKHWGCKSRQSVSLATEN